MAGAWLCGAIDGWQLVLSIILFNNLCWILLPVFLAPSHCCPDHIHHQRFLCTQIQHSDPKVPDASWIY